MCIITLLDCLEIEVLNVCLQEHVYLFGQWQSSLFVLTLYASVNSYGYVEMVSSPNHTFS